MKKGLLVITMLTSLASARFIAELPHIHVQEWGVITISENVPLVTSSPEEPGLYPSFPETDDEGYAVRAPVLYFNGPEFTGTVTVKTDNGAIFDIYPAVPDCDRTHSTVSWTASFSNDPIDEYPMNRGLPPGGWNYDMWRVEPALTVSIGSDWQDKFLYYETAPGTLDFLPYMPGAESVLHAHAAIPALVIRNTADGGMYYSGTLQQIAYGDNTEFNRVDSDDVRRTLYSWSVDILEPEQMDALWNTWAQWILHENTSESAYANGVLLYLVPQELTQRISTITVEPDETDYPVDLSRYILVAVPL